MEILCFFSGVAFFYFKNGYTLGLLGLMVLFRPRIRLFLAFLCGVLFAFAHYMHTTSRGMPAHHIIHRAQLKGVVHSIPLRDTTKTQFEFDVVSLNGNAARARVLLSCYRHCPVVSVGELWQVEAKLKPPQNLGNPGSFDYARSLKARHIEWVGRIYPSSFEYLGRRQTLSSCLVQLRAYFSEKLKSGGLSAKSKGILEALTLGLGQGIHQDTWGLFRRTGTTHLMVISGAHIGLVAGLTYGALKWLWARLGRFPLIIPAQRVAGLGAFLMALIYSVLAGFGVPAQRALVVCFFMLFRYFGRQSFSVWQAFRYALLFVLLFEPCSVLMPGFYLSFIAVGILITVSQVIKTHRFSKMLLMQLSCLVGLMPLTLFLFSYGSINGFFANLLAIPWVGFLIIPLGLLMVFGSALGVVGYIAPVLNKAIGILLLYLNWLDHAAPINLQVSLLYLWCVIGLMTALATAIIFPIKRFLPVSAAIFLSVLTLKQDKLHWGEASIDVLDVAQGLAVVVQTARHHLVYDTGVKLYQSGDMGERVITPYLKRLGVKFLDMVIISHPDLDHRGGLESLEKAFSIRRFLVDDPEFYQHGESCHQYPGWTWDGVSFQFLPMPLDTKKRNNRSCVLKVTTRQGSMLLTGDIESTAERYLLKTYPEALAAAFLLVPHHESKTSSSASFLKKVAPIAAIASYGFDNRYHFPHKATVARYKAQHIPVYSTEACGLIRVFLSSTRKNKLPRCTKYHKV